MQIIGHEFYPSERERVSISNEREIMRLESLGFKKTRTNKDDTITMKRRCRLMVKYRFGNESTGYWHDIYDEIKEKYGGKTEKEIRENFFAYIKEYYTRSWRWGMREGPLVPDDFYAKNTIEGALRIVGHEYIPPQFERAKKSETSKITYLKKEGYFVSSKKYKDGSIRLFKQCKLLLKVEFYEGGPGHWLDINGLFIPRDNYTRLSIFMRQYYKQYKVVRISSDGDLQVDDVGILNLRKKGII